MFGHPIRVLNPILIYESCVSTNCPIQDTKLDRSERELPVNTWVIALLGPVNNVLYITLSYSRSRYPYHLIVHSKRI